MRDIAIVGHGQSLIGAELGDYIDSHDHVLRFAKDPTDAIVEMKTEDFGDLIDILLYTETGKKRLHLDPRSEYEHAEHWIYDKSCGPDLDWLEKYQKYKRPDRAGHLSRGTAAVIMAAKAGYEDINLFGFDNIMNGNNEHYLSCFRDLKLTKKYHDYVAERRIIDRVTYEHGLKLECLPQSPP